MADNSYQPCYSKIQHSSHQDQEGRRDTGEWEDRRQDFEILLPAKAPSLNDLLRCQGGAEIVEAFKDQAASKIPLNAFWHLLWICYRLNRVLYLHTGIIRFVDEQLLICSGKCPDHYSVQTAMQAAL